MKLKYLLIALIFNIANSNPIQEANENITSTSDGAPVNASDDLPMDILTNIAEMLGSVQTQSTVQSEPVFPDCSILSEEIKEEVRSHQHTVDRIINYLLYGQHKGLTYTTLGKFLDAFGPRMSGTEALESSINATLEAARLEGFDDVHTEDVQVPHWVRNQESAVMVEPRVKTLTILGLGSSIGTPPGGIVAQIIVVRSFDELQAVARHVAGKIVVYNQPFDNYFQSVKYRTRGAVEAAKLGAVAALVRSAASFSINSPHTGNQKYEDGVKKIPVACITIEDAKMLQRLTDIDGLEVFVNLSMGAVNLPDATSRNTIIDWRGTSRPEDVVVISGHIDSWDVGAGAMDDAAGCFISYHANLVLKRLRLRARRTVRTIWFTGEEQGLYGGYEYFKKHRNESENYQLLLESDKGTFNPKGIGFSGSNTATCIMQEIIKLTAKLNTTELKTRGGGPDISMWKSIGVPIGSLHLDTSKYFWFHHSDGDTLEVEDPDILDRITALWASVAYVAANITANLHH
uniref:Carboxypeptidase Q n=1 Tax=Hirondellea gigas TaxID=1518452 RepID=A0A2P2I110_9CRUS